MKPETNRHASPRGDPTDPSAISEGLPDALAAVKVARPVPVLGQSGRQKKAPAALLTDLKPLNPGTGEEPR